MNYEDLKYGFTISYIEEMYAHYANLLHDGKDAPPHHVLFWTVRMEFYIRKHEEFYDFRWIATQLPLIEINPKS